MGRIEEAPASLKRSIGLRTVVTTSAGLTFASSTFLVVVTVAAMVRGNTAWLPILIAGILCALAAAAFSELNSLYPNAAGIRVYIQRAFGEPVALMASLTYMSVVLLVVGTESYVLSYVLHAAIPQIAPPVWILLMLTLATAANFRGLKVAGMLQDVITISVVLSILAMSLLALHSSLPPAHLLLHPGTPMQVFAAAGFAIFLFVGFEWVTPLAEEVTDVRFISRGMFIAVGLLTLVYALIATAMFAAAPKAQLLGAALQRNPIPHLTFAAAAFGPAGRLVMILTSICMSLTTFNAGLISVSRFLFASARDNVLPSRLAHLSVRYATPDVAVFVVYAGALAVSLFVYFSRQYVVLVNLAAATEALIYAFAGAAVVMLRKKEPQRTRAFRMAGGMLLPALVCILFVLLGLGVLLQPEWDSYGAGILLIAIGAGWWLYVRSVVMPRKKRLRAEQNARPSRRPRKDT